MGISFKDCQQIPKADLDDRDIKRQKFCFEISNSTISDGRRNCANGPAPPMPSVSGSLISREVPLLGTDWETVVDFSIWIGLQEEVPGQYCLWMGQEEAGVCVNDCEVDPRDPSHEKVTELVEEFLRELQAKNQNGDFQVPSYIFDIGFTVTVGVLVLAAIYLLGPGGALVGAAGA